MSENLGNTQPNIRIAKTVRGRTLLFNALGLIAILVLAVLAGYGSGIRSEKPTKIPPFHNSLVSNFNTHSWILNSGDTQSQNNV